MLTHSLFLIPLPVPFNVKLMSIRWPFGADEQSLLKTVAGSVGIGIVTLSKSSASFYYNCCKTDRSLTFYMHLGDL